MGIFDIFRLKQNNSQQCKQKDKRKARCPYCQKELPKIPGRKTKCLHCEEFMFVRTRPKDNTRIIVTQEEADKIDEEWSIVAGTHDIFITKREAFTKEKEVLRKRFSSKEPSDNDVLWSLLNKQLIEYAKNGDWGLYRNTRLEMAEILRKEMKLEHALQTYLEVCYIDLNGPNNNSGISDPELLKEFPLFNPKQSAFLAPGIINLVKRIIKELKFDKDRIKSIFIEHNSRIEKCLKLPISAENSWHSLEKEI